MFKCSRCWFCKNRDFRLHCAIDGVMKRRLTCLCNMQPLLRRPKSSLAWEVLKMQVCPCTLLNVQFFRTLSKCTRPDFVISGYPEYGSDPDKLDPFQRRELSRAAQHIRNSLITRDTIRAFVVVGHADKALRKPMQERAAFEREISQQRADAGREALLKELTRLAGGPAIKWAFRHCAIGIGNLRPVVTNAATEGEMRKNRRIEIVCVYWPVSKPCCAV